MTPATEHVCPLCHGAGKFSLVGWIARIRIEQLPEDYQLLARVIGLELTVKLARELKSVHLYLMKPDNVFKAAIIAEIKERYATSGPEQLFKPRLIALEMGVSERFVYDIIADKQDRDRQLEMFSAENCD